MRLEALVPEIVRFMPDRLEFGKLYISHEFETAIHLCACGCGGKTVMPFGGPEGWVMTEGVAGFSFTPSVGNWAGENPHHAHYYITRNKVIWC